jgi:hypothetical protein
MGKHVCRKAERCALSLLYEGGGWKSAVSVSDSNSLAAYPTAMAHIGGTFLRCSST